MKITRQTNIFVTTERKFIIRQHPADGFIVCQQCREPMISAPSSGDLVGISTRAIYRLIEAGEIHFVETARNEIYVCPLSVREIFNAANETEESREARKIICI